VTFRIIVDDEPRSEAMHHALDQVMLERLDKAEMRPTLRFWYRDHPAVPMGRFQSYRDEVQEQYAASNGIEVVRRITGGGAMYVEPGNVITYSMYLPQEMVDDDIEASYRQLDAWAVDALRSIGLDVRHEPLNDIMHPDGKIGGAAQLRKSNAVLHHATLSYNLDVEEMLRVLKIGADKLSDKAVKSAEKRVAVMRDYLDMDRSAVIDAMAETFAEEYGGEEATLSEDEIVDAEKVAEEKFVSEEWTRKM